MTTLSEKMTKELIELAQMQTREEEGVEPSDITDHQIDGQITLSREILRDAGVSF